MRPAIPAVSRRMPSDPSTPLDGPSDLDRFKAILGIPKGSGDAFRKSLPFTRQDTTAGAETELQVAVQGSRETVDLPLAITRSNTFKNIAGKVASGESPRRAVTELEAFLLNNEDGVWENSWVRFPHRLLSPYARGILARDLLADKLRPEGPCRCDARRFSCTENGEACLRLPVSYILKLALAEAVAAPGTDGLIVGIAEKAMGHFLNDNTSPETHSLYTVAMDGDDGGGRGTAEETLLRFLLSQLLTQLANRRFHLETTGQKIVLYSAPTPPLRQKRLNELIPDAFYRELFMSPCLSGWDRGERKHRYMVLCHEVLSRSQLNAVAKLREAGIIVRNLVVLPNTSNTSLANNGTHVSLGSRRLSRLLADRNSGLTSADEKCWGDLAIKIFEHFLPLFVGTYSAAPYRLDFADFHPERVLGFLPHELDDTHLRMIWRRWKKKARLKVLGQPLTPFGPAWLDRTVSGMFRLRGDLVADFRLIDYPVSLLSTEQSPALDGSPDSDARLKADLAAMGIFSQAMPLYLLYRLRRFETMGFSGFEGRHYSLFPSLLGDMAPAVDLQMLLTALSYQYLLSGQVSHGDIPDAPCIESERRQVFFGTAIGIPTFFVREDTPNRFLRRILSLTEGSRRSRRYPGFLRVQNIEYRKALLKVLRQDAADLIGMLGLAETVADLEARICRPSERAAADRLTQAILRTAAARSPLRLSAAAFNRAAESCYRQDLKRGHLQEALGVLEKNLAALDSWQTWREGYFNRALLSVLDGKSAVDLLRSASGDLLAERLSAETLVTLIRLMLLVVGRKKRLTGGIDRLETWS